ncbi:MAG: TIGR03790 family protein [Planctomycetota bacterium]
MLSHPKPVFRLLAALAGLTISLVALNQARATGGPENVLLVVNPRSPDSLCIANHYAELRHIPSSNFLFLDWDPTQENTDVDTFREKILIPVLRAAKLPIRGRQIDYVVYSSDFPWGIRIDEDIKKFKAVLEKQEQGKEEKSVTKSPMWTTFTPVASINGLTYLWEMMMTSNFYVHPQSNWYARTGVPEQAKEPTLGFSSATAYGPHGEAGTVPGRHYLLSMMLAVTAGRGNTRDEVLNYLNRSATADGTHPPGTIYFVQNGDIRSKVRQAGFPGAVQKLKVLGVEAEIVEGNVPQGKNDVQGAMLGVANFDWKTSQSAILPGAICEHFTSFGGDMRSNAGQTPLSELLRYGATAASGTVTEPYSIPHKFPSPMMQVHYARGCTVAESFYQSVLCPYQLLIVGDPLCRPWANIPEITCTGVTAGETVHDEIKVKPKARFAAGLKADHFEMILDGLKIRECPPDGLLEIDTTKVADGTHELRVVAVSKGPVPARGEKIIPFASANHQRTIHLTCTPEKVVSVKNSLIIAAKSPKSTSIRITQGTRLLSTITGDNGRVEIPAETLGLGPVRLQVVGIGDAGITSNVFAPPLNIVVEE